MFMDSRSPQIGTYRNLVLEYELRYTRASWLLRPSLSHPHRSAYAKYRFSVTPGTGTCSKLFNKQTKKLTEPYCSSGSVTDATFTCYLNPSIDPLLGIEIAKRFRCRRRASIITFLVLKFSTATLRSTRVLHLYSGTAVLLNLSLVYEYI